MCSFEGEGSGSCEAAQCPGWRCRQIHAVGILQEHSLSVIPPSPCCLMLKSICGEGVWLLHGDGQSHPHHIPTRAPSCLEQPLVSLWKPIQKDQETYFEVNQNSGKRLTSTPRVGWCLCELIGMPQHHTNPRDLRP